MVEVYVAPEVAAVEALHPYLRDASFRTASIRAQIETQADALFTARKAGDERTAMQIGSWWPGAAGRTRDEIRAARFDLDDALLTISREYGFASYDDVVALGERTSDAEFEAALDAMLSGDGATLAASLAIAPSLATARSRYGHRATLLHYLGANGVESFRQRTPLNAADLARLLIANGADPKAEANMYGGGQTAFDLAATSAHPHKAGVAADLMKALEVH